MEFSDREFPPPLSYIRALLSSPPSPFSDQLSSPSLCLQQAELFAKSAKITIFQFLELLVVSQNGRVDY